MIKFIKNLLNFVGMFITLILFLWVAYYLLFYSKVAKWNGALVSEYPSQVEIKESNYINYKNSMLKPLAYYSIKGVVLSRTRYFIDDFSDISPIDIAIAWNKMSVASVINEFKFIHRDRAILFYPKNKDFWPVERNEVLNSISNNCCIPANDEIREKLFQIKQYDVVSIRGQLVYVKKSGFKPWVSSLVRNDDFSNSIYVGSEIIYVDKVEILNKK